MHQYLFERLQRSFYALRQRHFLWDNKCWHCHTMDWSKRRLTECHFPPWVPIYPARLKAWHRWNRWGLSPRLIPVNIDPIDWGWSLTKSIILIIVIIGHFIRLMDKRRVGMYLMNGSQAVLSCDTCDETLKGLISAFISTTSLIYTSNPSNVT